MCRRAKRLDGLASGTVGRGRLQRAHSLPHNRRAQQHEHNHGRNGPPGLYGLTQAVPTVKTDLCTSTAGLLAGWPIQRANCTRLQCRRTPVDRQNCDVRRCINVQTSTLTLQHAGCVRFGHGGSSACVNRWLSFRAGMPVQWLKA